MLQGVNGAKGSDGRNGTGGLKVSAVKDSFSIPRKVSLYNLSNAPLLHSYADVNAQTSRISFLTVYMM